MKKKIIIILALLVMLISGLLLTIKTFNSNKVIVKPIDKLDIVLKETLETEFLSDVKVSNFIKNMDYTLEEDYKVDTDTVGTKTLDVMLLDSKKRKIKTSFSIEVIDVTPPLIWLDDTYSVALGSEANLLTDVIVVDDYDENITREVLGTYDLFTEGTYSLKYKATDKSGNESTKDFYLIVKDYEEEDEDYYYEPTYTYFSDIVDKYKNENTQIGLDISAFQGEVDFNALKKAGVEFLFLRVGSEDNDGYFIDKRFEEYYKGAKKVDIPVGVYFYSYANSPEYALKDANLVLQQIKGKDIDLPVVFDWEEWRDFNDYHFSFYKLYKTADAYFDVFRKENLDVMLYGSAKYLKYFWIYKDTPIWLAHYTNDAKMTDYQGDFEYWQIASDGIVDGIDGYVDIDVRFKKSTD